jgi:hypothetical protein
LKSTVQFTVLSLTQGDETYNQWLATLEFLAALPKGQLPLTVDTRFSQSDIYLANGGSEWYNSGVVVPDSVYIAEAEHTFDICKMIISDLLAREVRFKDLFWHFVWPELGERMKGNGCVELEEKKRDRGALLEQMVMGSEYKGEERGKYERRKEWNGYREEHPPWLPALT